MLDSSNELVFSFLGIAFSARGTVAFVMAAAVAVLIVAVAWKVIRA